ncbi:MAG: Gfo/Idh/MocA family oxidoreductase [Candidatus Firestonebacteria bacterium]|nr:Gfo/Idh/MocA family oxidoreductase [Candidatus Firestonebacteria bacterium]
MSLRIGVIGAGHMGSYHVRIYSELMDVELIGIADTNKARANELSNLYATKSYTDYHDLIGKLDAVSIAVPTSQHYKVAKDFLENGVHVLLEKPMTKTLEEGEELIELSRKNNLVFNIGHVERFNGAVQELKNIIKDPIYIETKRMGPYNPRIDDVGIIMDLMIHDIDIVLNLVNKDIEKINAVGASVYSRQEDFADIQIVFKGGCLASLTASRVTENKIRSLAVTQRDAYIFLDYTDQDLHIHRQAATHYILSKEVMRYKQESFIERLFIHKDNPLKLEIVHFLDCVKRKAKPLVTGESDLRSLRIALQVEQLLRDQGVIK